MTHTNSLKSITIVITSVIIISACSHKTPAPVVDIFSSHSNQASHQPTALSALSNNQTAPKSYIVKPGDTLFSIAWYHALDHKELAKINRLSSNLIFPGQKLNLQHKDNTPYFNSQSLISALESEVLQKTVYKRTAKISTRREVPKTRKTSLKRNTNKQSTRVKAVANRAQTKKINSLKWIWPTDGKILNRFSSGNASRGLDIAGTKGQPVRASASGRVVYEGNGLRGYGNLVIIKHDNNYLSAYAHNEKVYVSENEVVKAGQRIADIGNSGTQDDKLHFEIRYKGKPVDPLNYLPDR